MKTIVITGAGGPAGQALIAQLANRQIADEPVVLVGTDMLPLDDRRLSLSAVVPAASDPDYTVALRDLVGAVRADLVIPTVSEELPIIASLEAVLAEDPVRSGASDPFASEVSVIVPWLPPPFVVSPAGPTTVADDKLHTMWALDAAGVSVPAYAPTSAFASAQDAIEALGGSIVVKPRVSRGGRGVRVIHKGDDFDWQSVPPGHLVQRFAPGVEYCPQVYRSWDSGVTEVVVLEKTALRQGSIGNADGVRRVGHEADDVSYLATRAVEALGLVGPADLDIRRRDDGLPVVLEVNARFGACSESAPEILDGLLDDVFAAEQRRAKDPAWWI